MPLAAARLASSTRCATWRHVRTSSTVSRRSSGTSCSSASAACRYNDQRPMLQTGPDMQTRLTGANVLAAPSEGAHSSSKQSAPKRALASPLLRVLWPRRPPGACAPGTGGTAPRTAEAGQRSDAVSATSQQKPSVMHCNHSARLTACTTSMPAAGKPRQHACTNLLASRCSLWPVHPLHCALPLAAQLIQHRVDGKLPHLAAGRRP